MKDDLGNRMKEQYECRTRYMLPRRTYTILRLDGKAFHTYTKGLKKPFDRDLIKDMDLAIIDIMPEIQGAVFAYTQSDEISILLTDFGTPNTSAWFDGNLQKICSVSASLMTAHFNKHRYSRILNENMALHDYPDGNELDNLAYFDARVFTIPDRIEVMNYFIWRNQDCSRNSVSMVAQSKFSHKELQGKSTPEMHEMFRDIGVNWATDYIDREKNGGLIVKESFVQKINTKTLVNFPPTDAKIDQSELVQRSRWVSKGAWKFTEDKEKLLEMIPKYSE